MASRKLSDWLSGYLKYTYESEPPLSYHTWTGISLIAAALQRKVYMKWGYETIYPNMYIVLVGPSGRCRKGTAMKIGKELIKDIGIAVTSESITREALIRAMKNSVQNFTDPVNNKLKFQCALTALSEELSVFLGQNDVKFLADLTDWYDSSDNWTYETKGAGIDFIQGVCFNLLGATAPDWLSSILPEEAIGGGFTSRVIFVVEEHKRKTVPLPQFTKQLEALKDYLKTDLERITTLSGPMVFTPDAEQTYIAWYEEQDIRAKRGEFPINDPRFAGYCERRPTHIKKLCMIFSSSRGEDMVINTDDFERSHELLLKVEVHMKKAFGGLGASRHAKSTEKVLKVISSAGKISRSALLTQLYRDVDKESMDSIQETLAAMKVIKIIIKPEVSDIVYEYIGPEL